MRSEAVGKYGGLMDKVFQKRCGEETIRLIDLLDHAFQPIVNIHTGVTLGFEALLRGTDRLGYQQIGDFFEEACREGSLFCLDLALRLKALEKFTKLKDCRRYKLFYNVDNRLIEDREYIPGKTGDILVRFNLPTRNFVFEISEKHDFSDTDNIGKTIHNYRTQGYKIALDDFGVGLSSFRNFHLFDADYVKIDRLFIDGISKDQKKRSIVKSVVDISKKFGIKVVAEGLEEEEDFFVCKELGIDYVQGYLIAKPTIDLGELKGRYEYVYELSKKDKRNLLIDREIISDYLIDLKPVCENTKIIDVVEKLGQTPYDVLPVVDEEENYKGVIFEIDLRGYAYSRYGLDLLQNRTYGKKLEDFLRKIPTVDIDTPIDNILDRYAEHYEEHDFIAVLEGDRYVGLLDAKRLLKIVRKKELIIAQNLNPLTKLPGNTLINEFIESSSQETTYLLYFDFDNFKAFNDRYGFRRGDRLILFFADLLKKNFRFDEQLIGHIGGDDFFVGIRTNKANEVFRTFLKVIEDFNASSPNFYDKEGKEQGYIISKDRFGVERKFPFVSVSGVGIELPPGERLKDDSLLTLLKKEAKRTGYAFACQLIRMGI